MILVVGASGTLGGMITRRLLAQGESVRILVRDNSAYQDLVIEGARAIRGDLKDRASLDDICQDVDTVITTASATLRSGEDSIECVDQIGVANLIEVAQSCGVKRFIYISSTGADPNSPNPYFKAKGQNEERLRKSGMVSTILTSHVFLDFWLGLAIGAPLQAGQTIFLVGKGDHKHSFMSIQDLAAFAVAVIDHPAAYNQQLLLGGPEPISFVDIVGAVERVLDKELPVNFVPPGAPIPLVPEALCGFLYFLESYEMKIDMSELAKTYGVTLTTVEQLARQMFLGQPVSQ
jgi:uncharacterized protein YbjT (DUF2867 family)